MKTDQLYGLIRHALTFAGAILLIFFSGAETLINEVVASVIMFLGIILSWRAKNGKPLIEKVEGSIRHLVAIVTAFLIYFGKDDALTTVETITATVLNILPFILSFINKRGST